MTSVRSSAGDAPQSRLGFAVQLCALRCPGRLLRPGELIPHAPLAFIADQLDVDPEALTNYASRGPTRYEQPDTLRDVFGFRQLSRPARVELKAWLLPAALATTGGADLARVLLDKLRGCRIIVPGITLVECMAV
jgi:TnpA family transposase